MYTVHGKCLVGEKILVDKLQSVHSYAIYIFCVSRNIGKENFGE